MAREIEGFKRERRTFFRTLQKKDFRYRKKI